jgi:GNAT superfamily N-acetyltransferase
MENAKDFVSTIIPIIPDEAMFSFESQSCQFPEKGNPGLEHLVVDDSAKELHPKGTIPEGSVMVHCITWRKMSGDLIGILYYYPVDNPWEKAGNVNLYIDPKHRRQGIGTKLLDYAFTQWKIKIEQQRYSLGGAYFIKAYVESKQDA